LPFCYLTLTCKKPKDSAYPTELRTLGDHLRVRRLDLRLRQREVAERLGVSVENLRNWEWNKTRPVVRFLLGIFRFLGYDPTTGSVTFAEALRHARRAAGLSQEALAQLTGFDETTIAKWERGDFLPLPANLDRLRDYFQTAGQSLPGFEDELSYSASRRSEAARNGHRTGRFRA